jgi:hypothetical protein
MRRSKCRMEHAALLILRYTPEAIVAGRFEPDEEWAVYGWPARFLGMILLSIVAMVGVDVMVFGVYRDQIDWADEYGTCRIFHFFVGTLVAGFIYVLFRERPRPD